MLDLPNVTCIQPLFAPETDPPSTTFYTENHHIIVPYTW